MLRRIIRSVHTNNAVWQLANNKSLLAKLRKKTGYTFTNCKKALELHENDIEKAESWLKEQAQALGWLKAEKLVGRKTLQGLIALTVEKQCAVLAEINCETDFVSRNRQFHSLAGTVVTSVLEQGATVPSIETVNKIELDTEALKVIQTANGKTLADHTALTIGNVGENIHLRRALYMSVGPGIKIYGCTHPTPINPVPISFGRYGTLIAVKSHKNTDVLGMQLCQHIIGMNPSKIGNSHEDKPHSNADDETCMIYQEFLLDPNVTVQQLLMDEDAEIIDFVRFEMGEMMKVATHEDSAETLG